MIRNTTKVVWKLTIMNTKTGKVSYRKVKKTYDDVTKFVNKLRNKGRYNSVCAEEMNRCGKDIITDGRAVALDSREDEKLFQDILVGDLEICGSSPSCWDDELK